jgi:hypothetical protein
MRYVGRRDRHLAPETVVATGEQSVDGSWEQQGVSEADAG